MIFLRVVDCIIVVDEFEAVVEDCSTVTGGWVVGSTSTCASGLNSVK